MTYYMTIYYENGEITETDFIAEDFSDAVAKVNFLMDNHPEIFKCTLNKEPYGEAFFYVLQETEDFLDKEYANNVYGAEDWMI